MWFKGNHTNKMQLSNLSVLVFVQTIIFTTGFIGGFYKNTNIENASFRFGLLPRRIPILRYWKINTPIQDERWEDGEVPWDFVKSNRKTNGTEGNGTDRSVSKKPRFPITPIISGEKLMNFVFVLN